MKDCPCGSGLAYRDCCEPIIAGTVVALTAEQLLRSRYTAHAVGAIDFVIATNHAETRDSIDPKATEKWANESTWLGLDIKDVQAGAETDSKGQIEFVASYEDSRGRVQKHHELAVFEKENDTWFFRDAVAPRQEQVRREGEKIGRNDPCVCGSGLKYKKCCAKAS